MNKELLKGKLDAFPDLIKKNELHCKGNEYQTRSLLIEEFLGLIGIPIKDPTLFQREASSTIANEKCDYALLKEVGKDPIILIEAKAIDNPLTSKRELDQLAKYFRDKNAILGALTNGREWKWYKALPGQRINAIDRDPVIEFNCEDLSTLPWDFLEGLHFDNLDTDNIERLAYQELLKKKLYLWIDGIKENPSESFVKLALEESGLNQQELSQFVSDEEIKSTIKSLLKSESNFKEVPTSPKQVENTGIKLNETNFAEPKFLKSTRGGYKLWIRENDQGESNLKSNYFKALQWLCQNHKFGELEWLRLATKKFPRLINSDKVSNPIYWTDFYKNGNKTYFIYSNLGFDAFERHLKNFASITVLKNSKTAQYGLDLRIEKVTS